MFTEYQVSLVKLTESVDYESVDLTNFFVNTIASVSNVSTETLMHDLQTLNWTLEYVPSNNIVFSIRRSSVQNTTDFKNIVSLIDRTQFPWVVEQVVNLSNYSSVDHALEENPLLISVKGILERL